MATAVEIANMALVECGAEAITTLADSNERARACNAAWPFVRRTVLAAHQWNYPTKRALLDADLTAPSWDYATRYPLPADCIRVLEFDTTQPWRVEGAWIITDQTGDDIGVKYIYDETDPSGFSPGLTDALVLGLAYRICHRVTADKAIRDRLERQWMAFMRDGKRADGQEQSDSEFDDDTWITTRW